MCSTVVTCGRIPAMSSWGCVADAELWKSEPFAFADDLCDIQIQQFDFQRVNVVNSSFNGYG